VAIVAAVEEISLSFTRPLFFIVLAIAVQSAIILGPARSWLHSLQFQNKASSHQLWWRKLLPGLGLLQLTDLLVVIILLLLPDQLSHAVIGHTRIEASSH